MVNIVATVVLVAIVGIAAYYIVRAKRRGVKCIGCPAGGSCPSSKPVPKKKLEGSVIGKRTLKIEGMHCEHCAMNVTKVLNEIDGVCADDVSVSKGDAVVSYDRNIDDDVLREAVEKAGYHVTSVL